MINIIKSFIDSEEMIVVEDELGYFSETLIYEKITDSANNSISDF
jgi:hypothetical protein